MAKNRVHLLELAQVKLQDCIRLLELACKGDAYAKAYLIDHLKIYASDDHGFLSGDINIDKLIEKYGEQPPSVEGNEAYENDGMEDVDNDATNDLLERLGLDD